VPQDQSTTTPPQAAENDLPLDPNEAFPGNHPLEIAARSGFGPLSQTGSDVWHGNSHPCVSCGQLVPRDRDECPHCGQELTEDALIRMRAHAGPWYVYEHIRPFPGVTLERIIRQIRRGIITPTSIIRGPSTDHQWRFALETPGVCRYFGRCWSCHEPITPEDSYCAQCLSYLGFEEPRAQAIVPGQPASAEPMNLDPPPGAVWASAGRGYRPASPVITGDPEELQALRQAISGSGIPKPSDAMEDEPRVGRVSATWIVVVMVVVSLFALLAVVNHRAKKTEDAPPTDPAATSKTAAPAPGILTSPVASAASIIWPC
jgi:predicted RNA-binding Zn-ribbon protein involved in translation (DUF1610 family)